MEVKYFTCAWIDLGAKEIRSPPLRAPPLLNMENNQLNRIPPGHKVLIREKKNNFKTSRLFIVCMQMRLSFKISHI